MHRIDVRILDPRLKDNPPHYATPGAAGLDLRACVEAPLKLHPGDTQLIPTGIAIHLADPGLAALILPRSASKMAGRALGWWPRRALSRSPPRARQA